MFSLLPKIAHFPPARPLSRPPSHRHLVQKSPTKCPRHLQVHNWQVSGGDFERFPTLPWWELARNWFQGPTEHPAVLSQMRAPQLGAIVLRLERLKAKGREGGRIEGEREETPYSLTHLAAAIWLQKALMAPPPPPLFLIYSVELQVVPAMICGFPHWFTNAQFTPRTGG